MLRWPLLLKWSLPPEWCNTTAVSTRVNTHPYPIYPHHSNQCRMYTFFCLFRVQTLDKLLAPYYSGRKKVLIKLVNRACSLLGPMCFTALCMDNEDIWIVANVQLQCMEKCYYLIDDLWHFTVNVHHFICITTDPSCILNICFSLDELLLFIKGRLRSVGDRDINCPHCLLTFKSQITLYIRVFQKIRKLKLDSHVLASFNHSLMHLSCKVTIFSPTMAWNIHPIPLFSTNYSGDSYF